MAGQLQVAAELFGIQWMQHQLYCFEHWIKMRITNPEQPRFCVYYPTGKGKTKIMLTCLYEAGYTEVVVVTPPTVQPDWERDGAVLGMKVTAISHAKFRMKTFKLSRETPLIVDEFHMLGGHEGNGWKKLDRAAASLKAPLIIGSATPNYNDAERVYCIAHALDPFGNRGGYITWLYEYCDTEPNPFASVPYVNGFKDGKSAEEYLSKLPYVAYLPDEAPDIVHDFTIKSPLPEAFVKYNYDESQGRLMASAMEIKHRDRYLRIVEPDTGLVKEDIIDHLAYLAGNSAHPAMIFANHSSIASALVKTFGPTLKIAHIDGSLSRKEKLARVKDFVANSDEYQAIVGTASLSTGTDGLDKVVDLCIILDDTDDDSLRRQLVGRILPRGTNADYSAKQAPRFVFTD